MGMGRKKVDTLSDELAEIDEGRYAMKGLSISNCSKMDPRDRD